MEGGSKKIVIIKFTSSSAVLSPLVLEGGADDSLVGLIVVGAAARPELPQQHAK